MGLGMTQCPACPASMTRQIGTNVIPRAQAKTAETVCCHHRLWGSQPFLCDKALAWTKEWWWVSNNFEGEPPPGEKIQTKYACWWFSIWLAILLG